MSAGFVMIWVAFLALAGIIGFAGVVLTRYGDAIADKTRLGGTWIGVVLLAAVTSLPELITGISSVAVAGVPEIAVGDVFGSCTFNLLIIVFLDFLHREESVFSRANQGHILSAGFGILLIGFAGFSLLLADKGSISSLGHVGLNSVVIVAAYSVAMRTVFRYERQQVKTFTEEEPDRYPYLSLRQAVLRYAGAAFLVVGAGTGMPFVAGRIAEVMQWNQSFVGTAFVALGTSIPELVVTMAALRIGALDMAIGNLLGSNMFNIFILAVDDFFYLPGPLFSAVSPAHAVSALSAIMMTGIAIIGLLYRPPKRVFRTVGWASIFLFCIYLINSYMLFLYGSG
jgi:cation:H+ antiporter